MDFVDPVRAGWLDGTRFDRPSRRARTGETKRLR
jgi:hypothetical protein